MFRYQVRRLQRLTKVKRRLEPPLVEAKEEKGNRRRKRPYRPIVQTTLFHQRYKFPMKFLTQFFTEARFNTRCMISLVSRQWICYCKNNLPKDPSLPSSEHRDCRYFICKIWLTPKHRKVHDLGITAWYLPTWGKNGRMNLAPGLYWIYRSFKILLV